MRKQIASYMAGSILLVLFTVISMGCNTNTAEENNSVLKSDSQSYTVKEQTNAEDIFSELPEKFVFSSGSGGWATVIEINSDGTFKGTYHDSNMGQVGPDNPNGTTYICEFEGKFSDTKQIDEYSFSMKLEYLNCEGTFGEEYIDNGVKIIYAQPYGLEDADELMIYLPGSKLSDLPEEFRNWVNRYFIGEDYMTDDKYGIYNINGQKGFIGTKD